MAGSRKRHCRLWSVCSSRAERAASVVHLASALSSMSSAPSHRSNSTSRATPPKWRSSLSSPKKQKPAASVSVVFAQPEPGARLGSAIDRLPAVAIDDTASMHSVASRKRERLNSNASSIMSPDELRSDRGGAQIGQRERRDVERKRSRLTIDSGDDPSDVQTSPAVNGMLSVEAPGM